ncbi:class I SAM-dependent methyltransferase [Candidatus Pelagibacter sp.]|nr:class I SAM-dependent methyltransferase [Candidatus Pelagibacter sp.]|tara:strand:+ start:578 stop:1402 length:825 start_codon:yes stop_codon:yes gene_type:complete
MSSTLELFNLSKKNSIKYEKYFNIYDEILSDYRGKDITFVEIGVLDGGSLEIWKKYFGKNAKIIGIDLNPKSKKFEQEGIEIFLGDQSDKNFWESFFKKIGKVDIIIDDGGHTNKQQIVTTINSVKNINNGGMLIIEDTHTSYIREYGNPHKYSFVNFSKKIIDDINYTFFPSSSVLKKFQLSLNKEIYSIRYFESFCIFYIDRNRCGLNKPINNKGYKTENININISPEYKNLFYFKIIKSIFKKLSFLKFIYNYFILLLKKYKNNRLKKFFD